MIRNPHVEPDLDIIQTETNASSSGPVDNVTEDVAKSLPEYEQKLRDEAKRLETKLRVKALKREAAAMREASLMSKWLAAPVIKVVRGEAIRAVGDGLFVGTSADCTDWCYYSSLAEAKASAGRNDAYKLLAHLHSDDEEELKELEELRDELVGESLTRLGSLQMSKSCDTYLYAKPCGCVYGILIDDGLKDDGVARLLGYGICDDPGEGSDYCATHAEPGQELKLPSPVAWWKDYFENNEY